MTDRLYAREKRRGGPAIVLLHGFGGDHMEWYDIQPDLSRDGLVLAYDLPGHGRSMDAPNAGSSGGTAKALLSDLQSRGIERFHVAGYSMGGAIAQGDEGNRGSLSPGKWADMVALERDPFKTLPDELADIPVTATFLAGEIAYRA
jgi:predicted alpha/beta-fold hydrolase